MNAWNPRTIYQNLKFRFIRGHRKKQDRELGEDLQCVVDQSRSSAKTFPSSSDYAKATPAKINMGSAGPGSSPHLYASSSRLRTRPSDMVTGATYRGDGPAIPELIAGRIKVMSAPS